jgi:preprotein translocase SecE subunit
MARTTRRRATTGPEGQPAEAPRRTRDNLPRPAPAPVAAGVSRTAPAAKRRNPLSYLGRFEPRFIADIVSETRKVTWPSFQETRYLTVVVAIVATAVGLLLGGVDLFFGWIIEKVFFN